MISDLLKGLAGQRFSTIVVDPPWPYKARMKGSLFKGGMIKGEQRAVPFDEYPTLSLAEIAAIPIRDVAADGCHLYLWTTQAFLPHAFPVLDAWGFKPGAVLVWSKPPKGVCGTWVCSAEFCIFARRGTLKHLRRHIGTVFQWSRGGHSEKPEAFQDMIETVSPGPYLELFARRPRSGWTTLGDELASNDRAFGIKIVEAEAVPADAAIMTADGKTGVVIRNLLSTHQRIRDAGPIPDALVTKQDPPWRGPKGDRND